MSKVICPNGEKIFTVAALDKLAIYSEDGAKVYSRTDSANYLEEWVFVKDVEAGIEYVTEAFTVVTEIRIEAKASSVYYQSGLAASVLEMKGRRLQGTPLALATTGALTAAMISGGIVTSAAAAVTATLPTGAVMDASLEMEIGESFDWAVVKTGAGAFTVTASSAHTVVGVAATAATSSGMYRTRKTAIATYVTYRIG